MKVFFSTCIPYTLIGLEGEQEPENPVRTRIWYNIKILPEVSRFQKTWLLSWNPDKVYSSIYGIWSWQKFMSYAQWGKDSKIECFEKTKEQPYFGR